MLKNGWGVVVLGGKCRVPGPRIQRVKFSNLGLGSGICIFNEHLRSHLVNKNIALVAVELPNSIVQALDIKQPKSGESDVEIQRSDTKEGHTAHLGLPEPQTAWCSS